MTTTLLPQAKPKATAPPRKPRRQAPRHYADQIEGRYRPIHAHQLALAWWCYQERLISFRQLRTWFAAQEMVERRNYGRTRSSKEAPVFPIEELLSLIGGRGNPRTERDVQRELRQLHELGLLKASTHELRFAKSIDELSVGEGGSERFAAFLQEIPNRKVPVPRRIIRALAGGFRQADTAYVIAFLIRAVHWKASEQRFTVDGRMLLGKTAQLFGLTHRAFSAARTHLRQLGWITSLEVPQYLANRYGVHDVVNVDWAPEAANDCVDNPSGAGDGDVRSSTPSARFDVRSSSPDLTRKLPTEIENTRRPEQPDRSGVSFKKDQKKSSAKKLAPATIHDIQPHDLDDTDRLLELHRQFVAKGQAPGGESGRLDFLSLANRARTRGHNPGGLLRRLLQLGKTNWITLADEEVAARRLRIHLNGEDERNRQGTSEKIGGGGEQADKRRLTGDQWNVERCILAGRKTRIDPQRVAARCLGWTEEEWICHKFSYDAAQAREQNWHGTNESFDDLAVRFA